jgi:hypothetical protein
MFFLPLDPVGWMLAPPAPQVVGEIIRIFLLPFLDICVPVPLPAIALALESFAIDLFADTGFEGFPAMFAFPGLRSFHGPDYAIRDRVGRKTRNLIRSWEVEGSRSNKRSEHKLEVDIKKIMLTSKTHP